jgi:hypothetical protein
MSGGHFLIEIPARPEELLAIRELHAVAKVTLLLKGFSLRTKLPSVRKNLRTNGPSQIGCFATILSKIWLSVGPIFTVLPIALSFFICFRPVKYRIEALDIIYPMVRGRSAQSNFQSGQRVGQTRSTLVKLGQTSPNSEKCALDSISRLS